MGRTLISLSAMLFFSSLPHAQASDISSAKDSTDISFFDLPLEELMNIKITSVSKRSEKVSDAAAAIYVITQEDIRRSGATSIVEALRMAPGIQVAQIDSNKWAVSSRGFNRQFSNKLLVLMDGRTVYTPLFSGVFWDVQDTPLEDIERIEVIRGPGATLWGANAVNGVINIITKSSRNTQGTLVSGGFGSQEERFISARQGGKSGKNSHYRIYAKYNKHDSYEVANSNTNNNDDWDAQRGGFRFDIRPNPQDRVTLQGDIYSGGVNLNFNLPTTAVPYASAAQPKGAFSGANTVLKWSRKHGEGSETVFQTYIDYVDRDLPYVVDQRRLTYDLDFQHSFYATDSQHITWGAELRYISDKLRNSDRLTYTPLERRDIVHSAFVQDKITVLPEELFLTIGSKFEINDSTGFEFQPNVRTAWLVDDKQTVWASVSRAVRTPTRGEDGLALFGVALPAGALGPGTPAGAVYQRGNTSVESEDMTAYEIGYRVSPTEVLSFDIAAFYNDYEDLTTFEPAAPGLNLTGSFSPNIDVFYDIANLGKGRTYGLEIGSKWQPHKQLRLAANYSLLNVELETSAYSQDTLLEPEEERNPTHQFNFQSYLNLTHDIEWDNMVYYVDNLATGNIDAYVRVDTRLGWRPMQGVELSLAALNLFDDHQEFSESLYSAASEIRRSAYGKLTLNF